MRRAPIRTAGLALAGVLALSGCAAGPAMEQLPPALGGLPAGAPPRPATPYQYPAVHDMPPPRDTRPMTEEELSKTEKDLQTARDRQEAREGKAKTPSTGKRAAPAVKKQPPDTNKGQNTGAKTSP